MSNTKRPALAVLGLILVGGATAASPARQGALEIEASRAPGVEGLFDVRARNLSDEEQCIPIDVVRVPSSTETRRDFRLGARQFGWRTGGYIEPPLEGHHRLPPGHSVTFQVDARKDYPTEGPARGEALTVSLGIPHWRCAVTRTHPDDVSWSRTLAVRYEPPAAGSPPGRPED